jgi:PBSX family phage portal protein
MAKKTKGNLSLVEGGETSTIKVYGKDSDGRRRTAILKATAIDMPGSDSHANPTSHADEPDPFQAKKFGKHKIINPRYPLAHLTALKENSTELGQCIDSMVTNTVGFGYQLREKRMPEGMRDKFADEIELEKLMLDARLGTVHPVKSFTMLRESAKDDQHSNGNGYLELIDHPKTGELVATNYVRSYEVRLTEQDSRPTKMQVPWVNPAKNFTVETKPMHYRFRKFVMLRRNKPIWFKEAGDPRTLNKRTGEYDEDTKPGMQATSLLHFRVHSSLTPYGIPTWIGNLFSIYGSRSADELNWTSLKNNMIPSMFVIVENGVLTESSITRLREWTEQQVANSLNRSKFLILEGETLEEGAPTPANFKIKVEPLAQLQKDDQLFQDYDSNNREKIRQAFRLPSIFVGRSDDYTRSTADTSRDIADEQVFAPERAKDDFLINRFILARWGARFHTFRSNTPNITDDIELIRLMAFAERSGGMTPRRADRIVRDVFGDDIGPMPKGIDLDTPFSISFAQAQQGARDNSGNPKRVAPAPADQQAGKLVSGLLKLRKRIEDEIEDRVLNLDEQEDTDGKAGNNEDS